MRILAWLTKTFCFYFRCVKEDIRSTLIGKRVLNEFLNEVCENATFRALLKEVIARKIRLAPLSGFLAVWGVAMGLRKLRKCDTISEIAISLKLMEDFLKNKRNLKEICLSLAHELGHFDRASLEIELKKERKKTCKIKRNCLYDELLASKAGIQILEKITDKKFLENDSIALKGIALYQCLECLLFLSHNASGCPRIKELKDMGLIIKERGISI